MNDCLPYVELPLPSHTSIELIVSSENWCVSYSVGPPADTTAPLRWLAHLSEGSAGATDSVAPQDAGAPLKRVVGGLVVVVDMELLTSVKSAPSMSSESAQSGEMPTDERLTPAGEMSSRLSQSPPQPASLSFEKSGFCVFVGGGWTGSGACWWQAAGASVSEGLKWIGGSLVAVDKPAVDDKEDVTLQEFEEVDTVDELEAVALVLVIRARLWLFPPATAFDLATAAAAFATAAAALLLRCDTRRRGSGVRAIWLKRPGAPRTKCSWK